MKTPWLLEQKSVTIIYKRSTQPFCPRVGSRDKSHRGRDSVTSNLKQFTAHIITSWFKVIFLMRPIEHYSESTFFYLLQIYMQIIRSIAKSWIRIGPTYNITERIRLYTQKYDRSVTTRSFQVSQNKNTFTSFFGNSFNMTIQPKILKEFKTQKRINIILDAPEDCWTVNTLLGDGSFLEV